MSNCVLCVVYRPATPPRLPHWPPVCDGCRTQCRRELVEIIDAYALLPAALVPTKGHAPRVSGSKEPPVPLNIDAVTLLGPGAAHLTADGRAEEQIGELPTAVLLDQWVGNWIDLRAHREHLPVPTVMSLVGWLEVRLDWALDEHPAIDEFAVEVRGALGALRAAARTTRYRGERAGRCPAILRDDSRCNIQLYADPYLDRITCSRCGSAWPRVKWLALRAAQDEPGEAA